MKKSITGLLCTLLLVGVAAGQVAEPMKPMAPDADPAFEVATIKPDDSGIPTLLGISFKGRNFTTKNSSLGDLIGFAYGMHAKQVADVPKEMEKQRWDISGVPDLPGVPNIRQQQMMVRKLLADRFKLKFHNDKREMAAFVLTTAKDGPKLTPTKLEGLNPINGVHPSDDGWLLSSQNASMAVLAGFLQLAVLDRPVADHTALTGRYDFAIDFTPDSSQFNGHPPPPREAANPAPPLFEAVERQYGLKLSAEKTMVEVVIVDHAEPPSAN